MQPRTRRVFGTSSRTGLGWALVSILLLLGACGGNEDDVAVGDTPDAESTAVSEDASEEVGATEEQTVGGDATPADSTAAESALEGETVELVVPYDAGGGYDQYGRLIAPFLADCLAADVIVLNEPGAGGLLATSQTAVAPPDGTRIQLISSIGGISAQIAEAEGVNFDLNDVSWLGRFAAEPLVVSVAPDSEFETFQDMIDADRPIRFASTGPGSLDYITPTLLSQVYGFEIDLITGFAGTGESQTAVARGDADAHAVFLDSALGFIEAGEARPLVLVGAEASDSIPETPTTQDMPPEGEADRAVLDAYIALAETGRSVIGGPELPDDLLTSLREGLECALSNEEFLAQSEQAGRPIDYLSGEEMTGLVQSVTQDSPEAFRQLIRKTFS